MKSEPEELSIDQLKLSKRTPWTGVRNYQARNFMMNDMQIGDLVLFYHSNANPSGVAGLAKITQLAAPDELQFNKKSEYYDPKAKKEKPIWYCVEVGFVEKWPHFISLDSLKQHEELQDMLVLKRGQRLSIQPVRREHFDFVCQLGRLGTKK